ncbi:Non-homologous end-joining factor 1 [Melipona quadrifasciata]|uniref:Non-homologous end-joining factor 1 n=1 Tax=Melipona quadrifasciata TaxID=166423 RepID=A0A0N1IT32_9HYME|nr:Non-homologous end-joining factor 1 [Melipona quadrifasciata]
MGVLIAPPEAGDASINIIPQMKKYPAIPGKSSKSLVPAMSEKNVTNRSALMTASNYDSTNNINKDAHRHTVLMDDNMFDKMSSSTIHDSCQFPYYRSNKNDKCTDAVLVKDIGVSCKLLNQNTSKMSLPETRILVKHLKKEYNDLTSITNKITAYTKDILSHLSKKNQRKHPLLKDLIASKHAIASQYVDTKGNLCLKLRLFSNAETQCTAQQVVKNSDNILCKGKYVTKESQSKNSKNQIYDKNDIKREDNNNIKSKHEKDIQTLIDQRNVETNTPNSTSSSISSIYNYLTMRRKKTSNESLNTTYVTFNDVHKNNKLRKINDNKDCVNQLKFKRHCPAIFTNWKEISNSKQSKNKSLSTFSTEAQQTEDNTIKVFLTNLIEIWMDTLTKEIILDRCRKLNPLLNVEDLNYYDVVLNILNNISRNIINVSVEHIKLRAEVDGGTMKFDVNLTKGTSQDFWEIITKPLCTSSMEISRQHKFLLDLVKKKDEEISEYKAGGAELIRKNIETKRFKEEQLKITILDPNIIDCINIFQSAMNFYNVFNLYEYNKISKESTSSNSSNNDDTQETVQNRFIQNDGKNICNSEDTTMQRITESVHSEKKQNKDTTSKKVTRNKIGTANISYRPPKKLKKGLYEPIL